MQGTLVKNLRRGTLSERPLGRLLKRLFTILFQRQKFRLRAMEEFMDFAHEHCEKRAAQ